MKKGKWVHSPFSLLGSRSSADTAESTESRSHGEVVNFGNAWTEIDWRVGDFGPFFWSRVAEDYRLPVERFRYLRISVGSMNLGETIEVRNLGIARGKWE